LLGSSEPETGGAAVQLILLALNALLVEVIAAHQHADLIVMMQRGSSS
jgi:hypothetical protein